MKTNRLIVKKTVRIYAETLIDAVSEQGGKEELVEVRDQLEQVSRYLHASSRLKNAAADHSYEGEKLKAVIESVFDFCNPLLRDLIVLMAERGDIELINRVMHDYENLLASKFNLVVVDVTTKVELDDSLRELIRAKAAERLGKDVVIYESIDPSILGGIVMYAGGKRIDASVRSQLDQARDLLKKQEVGGER